MLEIFLGKAGGTKEGKTRGGRGSVCYTTLKSKLEIETVALAALITSAYMLSEH
jgi:hypothetical protein